MENNHILNELRGFLETTKSMQFLYLRDMVEPVFDNSIDTACIIFDNDSGECIQFLFNEKYWNSLNYNEKAFLFMHECLHVLFFHGKRGIEYINSLSKEKRSLDLLNVAMDVAINELILDQYMNGIPRKSLPTISNLCFIDNVFGERAGEVEKGKVFTYYYEKYLEFFELSDSSVSSNMLLDSHTFLEYFEEIDDELKSNIGIDPSQTEESNNLKKETEGYEISSVSSGEVEKDIEKQPETLEDFLKLVISTSFKNSLPKKKSIWHEENRRSSFAFRGTGMHIPKKKKIYKKESHKILAYCDVSPSCRKISNNFFGLISELDVNKFDVDLYVFAGKVAKGIKTDRGYRYTNAGLGTNIDSVLSHYKKYVSENSTPDAVFVLTDGVYTSIRKKNDDKYSRWIFFIGSDNEGARNNYPQKAKGFRILK